LEFAGFGARKFGDEFNFARSFERRDLRFAEFAQLVGLRRCRGAAVGENDERFDIVGFFVGIALADDGDLIILAPGVKEFGEDPAIDVLIRKYGYRSTPETLAAVKANPELAKDLSAAAHLIHGSSEGRFRITYCPGGLTREEVESVGYNYASLETMLNRYDPAQLKDGWNTVDGEEIFFISNPALGLWAHKSRL